MKSMDSLLCWQTNVFNQFSWSDILANYLPHVSILCSMQKIPLTQAIQ